MIIKPKRPTPRPPTITPFLWFDGQAEEATNFYVSIFRKSRVLGIHRQGPKGPVMGTSFILDGQRFQALNGGPHFKFTPALSLFVNCRTQAEVDHFWEKLSAGGAKERCGWLRDKFGVSWQIIPELLGKLLGDKDPKKAAAVMKAMLQMNRIDIKSLQRAHQEA